MNAPLKRSIEEMLGDNDLLLQAINRATRDAVLMHARAGNPVATWRDGQVVWLQPEEVLRQFGEIKVSDGHHQMEKHASD
jgi:hypothetical protein